MEQKEINQEEEEEVSRIKRNKEKKRICMASGGTTRMPNFEV